MIDAAIYNMRAVKDGLVAFSVYKVQMIFLPLLIDK